MIINYIICLGIELDKQSSQSHIHSDKCQDVRLDTSRKKGQSSKWRVNRELTEQDLYTLSTRGYRTALLPAHKEKERHKEKEKIDISKCTIKELMS